MPPTDTPDRADVPEIDLTVYPDECDAFGHLNQASFLSLFERARWEMLARGPGMDVFSRMGAWPAVRRTAIDYHAAAFPGDVLRFSQALVHHGRTSFTMRQTARRVRDDALIATAEFVFVTINREGRPVPVPEEVGRSMNARPLVAGDVQRVTVNGVSLAVEVQGAADAPAILFVHGYPLNRTMWADQLAALDGWRRIAPDLRGMGQSDAPDLGYSITTYAADLAALLDTLGVEEVVLVGLSMGGYVAFELLRRHRGRVRALVLLDTRAEPDSAEGKRARDAAAAQAREGGAKAIADQMLGRMLADGASAEALARTRRMIEAAPVPGIVGALAAMRDRPDSTPLLPTLEGLPTLVVVGEHDALTPPDAARRMAEAIPGARVEVIPGAGHLPPVEQAEATSRVLRDFLEGLPGK
jgi:YbgC/YbaW family acyl-CoA thioester hydrolase